MAVTDQFNAKQLAERVSRYELLAVAEVLVDQLKRIKKRLHELEPSKVTKSLDAEAFDTMAEMAERVDRLEATLTEIADNGFRYRGYWRSGMRAKRGDAFTHDGSLWWACRDADDPPSKESPNWNIAVRKGRDGK